MDDKKAIMQKLRVHGPSLLEAIKWTPAFMRALYAEMVIERSDLSEIKALGSDTEKSATLVAHIECDPTGRYPKFLAALRETGQTGPLKILELQATSATMASGDTASRNQMDDALLLKMLHIMEYIMELVTGSVSGQDGNCSGCGNRHPYPSGIYCQTVRSAKTTSAHLGESESGSMKYIGQAPPEDCLQEANYTHTDKVRLAEGVPVTVPTPPSEGDLSDPQRPAAFIVRKNQPHYPPPPVQVPQVSTAVPTMPVPALQISVTSTLMAPAVAPVAIPAGLLPGPVAAPLPGGFNAGSMVSTVTASAGPLSCVDTIHTRPEASKRKWFPFKLLLRSHSEKLSSPSEESNVAQSSSFYRAVSNPSGSTDESSKARLDDELLAKYMINDEAKRGLAEKHFIDLSHVKKRKHIADGTFGIIEMYVDKDGRKHTVKSHTKLKESEDVRNEFIQDFFLAREKNLNHRRLVFEPRIGCTDGTLQIVLPYFKSNLKVYLKEKKRDTHTCVNFCLQIAEGMDHLEFEKIIHGRLMLEKILVNKKGEAVIGFFGMGHNADRAPQSRYENKRYTSKAWQSPETLKFMKPDTKADVWSFGVVTWEIFSPDYRGHPYPVEEDKIQEYLEENQLLPKPKDCPRSMYVQMKKWFQKEPEKRPKFNEIRVEIDKIIKDGDFGTDTIENVIEKKKKKLHTELKRSKIDEWKISWNPSDSHDAPTVPKGFCKYQSLDCYAKVPKGFKCNVDQALDGSKLEDFLSDFVLAKELPEHGHVLSPYGVVLGDKWVSAIYPFMDRGNLHKQIRDKKLDQTELMKISSGIVDGMNFLEKKNITVQKLTPKQVLLDEDGAKLAYFHKADVVDHKQNKMGTLSPRRYEPWLAPESVKYGVYTSKSNVWSFGLIMWAMWKMTLDPPYSEEDFNRALDENQPLEVDMAGANDDVKSVMDNIFDFDKDKRPSFSQLHTRFEENSPDAVPSTSFRMEHSTAPAKYTRNKSPSEMNGRKRTGDDPELIIKDPRTYAKTTATLVSSGTDRVKKAQGQETTARKDVNRDGLDDVVLDKLTYKTPGLMDRMELTPQFLAFLEREEAINRVALNSIKDAEVNEKVTRLIDYIRKDPFHRYTGMVTALRETGQHHVLDHLEESYKKPKMVTPF